MVHRSLFVDACGTKKMESRQETGMARVGLWQMRKDRHNTSHDEIVRRGV
jgi:hypothetical protein